VHTKHSIHSMPECMYATHAINSGIYGFNAFYYLQSAYTQRTLLILECMYATHSMLTSFQYVCMQRTLLPSVCMYATHSITFSMYVCNALYYLQYVCMQRTLLPSVCMYATHSITFSMYVYSAFYSFDASVYVLNPLC